MDTVKVDSTKRIRLPDAKPGQVFAYSADGHGRIVLTEVQIKAGKPDVPFLNGIKPLSRDVLDRLYRQRQGDDEAVRLLADNQAWFKT